MWVNIHNTYREIDKPEEGEGENVEYYCIYSLCIANLNQVDLFVRPRDPKLV